MYLSLSPSYVVRNEANASFLTSVDKIIRETGKDFSAFSIPPFIGYIISHVSDSEYPDCVNEIARNLKVSSVAIDNFIQQLIENDDDKEFKFSDSLSIVFPKKLLIRNTDNKGVKSNVYEDPEFEFSGEFRINRPSVPISVNLMVTTRCTTDCMYCYANRNLHPVLTTVKLLDLIEELHDQGTVNLSLTGGDIFAHPDWRKILECVRMNDYKPFLSTKTPLNYDDIRFLKNLGYDEVQFSLDSVNPCILEKLIKVNKEYVNKVEDFLEFSTELGLDVQIRSVLTKLNASIEDIRNQYKFLSRFRCVKEWDMTPAFFSPYKQKEYKSLEVNNNDLVSVYEFSKREDLAFRIGLNKISKKGYVLKKYDNVEDYVCRNQICMANTTCISILANGECSVCEMLYDNPDYILGNVNQSSVKDIWNSDKALKLYSLNQHVFPDDSPCKKCGVFEKCRNEYGKRVCYLDIMKSGKPQWYPDPRCPEANNVELIL